MTAKESATGSQQNTKASSLKRVGPLKLDNKRVVLLLQGGGALGAYQVGAYEALSATLKAHNIKLDWVGGISIGAINAAIIAGSNGNAAANLLALWKNDLLSPEYMPYDVNGWWKYLPSFLQPRELAPLMPKYLDWGWTAYNPSGQQNFFSSRVLNVFENPWFRQWWARLKPEELAFYGTERLKETLMRHLGGANINTNGTRLSLGATRVTDGEVVFFNNVASVNPEWPAAATLTVDHVLASGALPPAFPAIEIECEIKNKIQKDWYWDGGLSTNTPIEALSDDLVTPPEPATKGTIVFLVDLWDRKGSVPRSLDEVLWRQKSIQFGSRKKSAERVATRHQLMVNAKEADPYTLEICQVMFEREDGEPGFSFSDADFSHETFEKMRKRGFDDMETAIREPYQVYPKSGNAVKDAALYRHGTDDKHLCTDSLLHLLP
jgi:NTE family protein